MVNYTHPVNVEIYDKRTIGDKAADATTNKFGSWGYIIGQTIVVIFWIVINTVHGWPHWDSYPFIFLNLAFSTQASYAAPIILLSQNRQAKRDRIKADHDYIVNQKSLALLRHIVSVGGASPDDVIQAEQVLDESTE